MRRRLLSPIPMGLEHCVIAAATVPRGTVIISLVSWLEARDAQIGRVAGPGAREPIWDP